VGLGFLWGVGGLLDVVLEGLGFGILGCFWDLCGWVCSEVCLDWVFMGICIMWGCVCGVWVGDVGLCCVWFLILVEVWFCGWVVCMCVVWVFCLLDVVFYVGFVVDCCCF